MAGLDSDALAPESLRSVLREALVEHGKNFGRNVINGDLVEWNELWIHPVQIFSDEIMQLCRKFDPCGASTDDGEVEQVFLDRVGGGRECGRLEAGE